jgi:putative inorganic carbon (hco3(-)) transporter
VFGVRDLLVGLIVFGLLPLVFKRPFVGILLLAGLGYMNPHRLCYTFMRDMPVVMIVVLVTFIGMLASREARRMTWSREIVVLVMFIIWMGITTTQAFYFDLAFEQFKKVFKIQILTFMTLIMLTSVHRLHALVWAIVLSLGFYGVKGGIFTIMKGGVHRVQGPPGTFIEGNNEMALALVMTIPLMRYLHLQESSRLVRAGLVVAMVLTSLAAVGSQSRGALVALVVTGSYFWWKSRQKFLTTLVLGAAIGLARWIMPEEWYARMRTIETYDQDASAIGRINAWWTAWNTAMDRVTGGGFEMWRSAVFARYAPDPSNVRDVHSIYFEILGEHGFIGLFFYLTLIGLTWLTCWKISRLAKKDPGTRWAADLATMIQVTLVGYMSAGAFLGLAYFDYFYHLVAIVVVTHALVRQRLQVGTAQQPVSKPEKPTLWTGLAALR